jgi:hypothetical protein
MAQSFIAGEKKVRPGVYFRYENIGTPPTAGADDGKVACVFRSNWGPLGKASDLDNYADIAKIYGDGGTDGTTNVPLEAFHGGAQEVFALRVGSGGTAGTYAIMDTASTAANVITLTLKYPGSRSLTITIRPTAADANTGELIIYDGTTQLEQLTFDMTSGVDQVTSLMDAYAATPSAYYTLAKLEDSTAALATVTQAQITAGTDPTVDGAAYTAAFGVLEAYHWNVLCIDTDDVAIHALVQAYIDRIFDEGNFGMACIGEPTSVAFTDRLSHAKAFNDYKIVYVGNGWIDSTGVTHEGYLAAAYIAGLIASTPSNQSITHLAITGAVELSELLTNAQYVSAIQGGMLTLSTSAANTVWVEQGINTLVLPGGNDDQGWKKIKRVKVRFELMQRCDDTIEPLTGRINNDADGRANIIQLIQSVENAMIAEGKLLPGATVELDPDNTPEGDSAWFIITADDIDALEKMYLTYQFRFSPPVTAAAS